MDSYPDTDEHPDRLYYVEFNRGGRPNEFTIFKRQFFRSPAEMEKLKAESPEKYPLIELCNECHPWNIFTAEHGADGCMPDKAWVCWMVDALNEKVDNDFSKSWQGGA